MANVLVIAPPRWRTSLEEGVAAGAPQLAREGRVRSPDYGSYAEIASGCSRKAINWLLLSGKIA